MKKREKGKNFLIQAHETLRAKPTVATVYIVLRFLVLVVLVAQFFNRNFENVFLCVLTLGLFLLPTMLEKRLRRLFRRQLRKLRPLGFGGPGAPAAFVFAVSLRGKGVFFFCAPFMAQPAGR